MRRSQSRSANPAASCLISLGYANEILEVDRVGLRDGPTLISIGRIFKFVVAVSARRSLISSSTCTATTKPTCLGFLSGAPHRLYSRRPNRSLDFLANFKPQPAKESKSASRRSLPRPAQATRHSERAENSGLEDDAAADFAVEALLKEREGAIGRTAGRHLFRAPERQPPLAARSILPSSQIT